MRSSGDTFAHYTIESLLGQGGMGEVYRAFDTKLHRRVALKLLLAPETSSAEARKDATARMIREARAAAAVDHPNKVGVHELGEVDGVPYIAMEYIAGTTLRQYVGDESVPWTQKLGWLLDVARALEAAHAAGLVHRDIKPENVMLREDGIVKVLDFGIARNTTAPVDPAAPTAAPAIATITGAGVIIGTAAYMPPEQMHGHELDGRADQFAWGVMAFELLGGRHPWSTSGDAIALVGAMLTRPAARLRDVWPQAPSVVDETVARTLSANRDPRFPKMADVVAALAPALGATAPAAPPPSSGGSATSATAAMTSGAAVGGVTVSEMLPSTARPRRLRILAVAGAVALTAITVASGFRLAAMRQQVTYCADWNLTNQGPRCRVAAGEETMKERDQTFRLTSDSMGVTLVERLNSAGVALWGSERVEISRAPDGAVREVVKRIHGGDEVQHELWAEGGKRMTFVESDGVSPRHAEENGVRITAVRREYDANGFARRGMYFGVTGKPRSLWGMFGYALERAPSGFVVRETYLDADGTPMANERGIATVEKVPDVRGVEVERRFFDLEGKPASFDGVEVMRQEFSAALELQHVGYFDSAGRPLNALHVGVQGTRTERETSRRTLRTLYVDKDGKQRQRRDETFSSEEQVFDQRGRRVGISYRDPSGNGVEPIGDTSGYRWVWDDRDLMIAQAAVDPAGQPTQQKWWGYAAVKVSWDDRRHLLEQRHLDEQGHLVGNIYGVATAQFTHDERGLEMGAAYFDTESKPVADSHGVASFRDKFDRLRNNIESENFGPDGRPCVSDEGVGISRRTYDADDNLVEESFFDATGAPTFGGDRAKTRWKHDTRGLVVEESTYDTNDNLVLVKDGYSTVRFVRDRSGDVTEESYFGKRGEPVLRSGGYARKRVSYDIRRRRAETALFDAAGAPVVGSEGWSLERIAYDERGLIVREAHFDVLGKPTLTKTGSAAVETGYNDRGKVVSETNVGLDGKPIGVDAGFATKKMVYDERDLLIEQSLFGADGAPIPGKNGWSVRKMRYDASGNLVEEAFFDVDRKPVVAKDPPYATKRDKYDAHRRIVETAYFDPSGVPAKGPDGAETVRYSRDVYGRPAETSFLDAAGSPATSKEGKQVIRSKYDSAGRLTEELFIAGTGEPRISGDGCAGHRTKYDDRGRKLEETCLDDKSGLVSSKAGWASKRTLHDARGNVVDEARYAATGKLAADAAGVARRKNRYDERGLLQETTFFDAEDKPVSDKRGVASIRYRYDDAGKQVEEIALDDKGKPVTVRAPKKKG